MGEGVWSDDDVKLLIPVWSRCSSMGPARATLGTGLARVVV